jgi:hypothetical protein
LLTELTDILDQIYAPSGLFSIASGMFNNNIIFLDLQIPSPQATVKDLKFGMYSKPGNCYKYSHFNSCINSDILSGLVVSES